MSAKAWVEYNPFTFESLKDCYQVNEQTLKAYRSGTHRAISPLATLERLRPLLKQMGITRVADVTGLDSIGIPVVTACRPNARSVSVSQGKGLDLVSAKVSAMMEAIELYHAEHIDADLKLASFNEMQNKYNTVDVDNLPQLTISRFHAEMKVLWICGLELIADKPLWVPFDMVHANYTLPLPSGSGAFIMSTNGLASGNHSAEATVHALCELIERDASTLWFLNRDPLNESQSDSVKERVLNLDSVTDQSCRSLLKRFKETKIEVVVWDVTSDIGIPSFYCHLNDQLARNSMIAFPAAGSGTHPCREVALIRALTEAAQTRLTFITGSRDDIQLEIYRDESNGHRQDSAGLTNIKSDDHEIVSYKQIPNWQNDSFEADIDLLLERLVAVGIKQVALVDLTKPEYELSVYRAIVPGLEAAHDVPGYLPGQRAKRFFQARKTLANPV